MYKTSLQGSRLFKSLRAYHTQATRLLYTAPVLDAVAISDLRLSCSVDARLVHDRSDAVRNVDVIRLRLWVALSGGSRLMGSRHWPPPPLSSQPSERSPHPGSHQQAHGSNTIPVHVSRSPCSFTPCLPSDFLSVLGHDVPCQSSSVPSHAPTLLS